jgi:hypothetical protein
MTATMTVCALGAALVYLGVVRPAERRSAAAAPARGTAPGAPGAARAA